MELTEQLFMEITGVRLSTPIYESGPEKRHHTRVSFGQRARIYPLMEMATGNGSPVLVRDLSRSGVGFQINDELTVGDEFVLQLQKQSGGTVHLQSIVQRCEPGGTGLVQFVVGATFELVLTEAQWKPPQAAPQARAVPHSSKHPAVAMSPAFASAEADDSNSSRIRSRLSGLGGQNRDEATLAKPDPVLLVEPAPVLSADLLTRARNKLFAANSAEPTPAAAEVTAEQVVAPVIQTAVNKPLPPLEPLPAIEEVKPAATAAAPVVVVEPVKVEQVQITEVAAPAVAVEIETAPAMIETQPEEATASQIESTKAVEIESKPAEVIEPIATPVETEAAIVEVKPAVAVESPAIEEAEVLVEEVVELIEPEVVAADVVEPVKAAPIKPAVVASPVMAAPVVAAPVVPAAPAVAPVSTVTPMQAGSSPMLVLVVPTGPMPAGQQSITVTAGGISVTVSFASAPAVAPIAAQPAAEFAMGVTPESMFDLLAESLGDETSASLAA